MQLDDLIDQATTDDEFPAASGLIETLKEQAQLCTSRVEAQKIAAQLQHKLECPSLAVRLKALQLVTLMLHEACAPILYREVQMRCSEAVQRCLVCAQPHPTRGDKPASLIRNLGSKAARLLERTRLNRSNEAVTGSQSAVCETECEKQDAHTVTDALAGAHARIERALPR
eukprot:SAG31_NODE_17505_length_668_cov_1.080844_1_plen_170_part_10